MAISTTEVAKLRKMTGAGLIDCKKALEESNGNFEEAEKIIRKKGKMIADKRADRDASEGCVIAKLSADGTKGVLTALCCETDFVAKGTDFIKFTEDITDAALKAGATDLNSVNALTVNDISIADGVEGIMAVIGEKIELAFFNSLEAAEVVAYIHPGNKLACLVGFNKKLGNPQTGRDIAMQVASMAPVAVDKDSVPADVVAKEFEIATDQAQNDPKNAGKPAQLIEKIAQGKLDKFFKEMTLLNQIFIKDNDLKVSEYLNKTDKELQVTNFVRFSLAM